MDDLGRRVVGVAAIALGLIGLWWGDFAITWQPVPDEAPARVLLAYAAALLFVAGGAALLWRRSAAYGAVVVGLLYLIFALLWSRRIVGYPHFVATWAGTAEQLAVAAAALILFVHARRRGDDAAGRAWTSGATAVFGICAMLFGANHFANLKGTAQMVPAWIPPSQWWWAAITGAAMALAGAAILLRILDLLAARLLRILDLLAARLLTFLFAMYNLFVWGPSAWRSPGDHDAWAGNATNLGMVGAAWVIADHLARRARRRQAEAETLVPVSASAEKE